MDHNRVSAGVPTGGQFAAHTRSEASIDLAHPRSQPGDYITVERPGWLGRSESFEVNADTGLTDEEFDTVTNEYLAAALWTGYEIDEDGTETNLDGTYDIHDFSDQARQDAANDLHGFISGHRGIADSAFAADDYDGGDGTGAHGMFGHDFWLTRNHHGAGFWDRGALSGDLGRELSSAAHTYGSVDVYVGDDQRLHFQ